MRPVPHWSTEPPTVQPRCWVRPTWSARDGSLILTAYEGRHTRLYRYRLDGDVATLTMDVDENGGLFEGYLLKLNSYDLGVDIELADALQRLRFEHPDVRTVVVSGDKDKVFCAGANIWMLAQPYGYPSILSSYVFDCPAGNSMSTTGPVIWMTRPVSGRRMSSAA